MNERMFNDTPAQILRQLLGISQKGIYIKG